MKNKDSILRKIKPALKEYLQFILIKSLMKAAKEQNLDKLVGELKKIVPDIKHQYTTFKVENHYQTINIRQLHSFQISLVNEIIYEFDRPVIVDIGDSTGTHLQYIMGFHSRDKDIKCFSINLDSEAIERIEKKGLKAIQTRAEDLNNYNIHADVFLCFETLEHIMNPCFFLHELSSRTNAKYLIISVPYLRTSRVGLHHIRLDYENEVCAENTHIFELCPDDWKLIVRHSGWNIVKEKIYLQYPKKSFWRITRYIWKRIDFEGFYGMILSRDDRWPSKYRDWKRDYQY